MKLFLKIASCVGALMLLGAACGTSPSAGPRGSASPTATPVTGWREFGLTDEQFNEYVEKVQTLLAGCMTEAGFEYVPVDVKTIELAQARVRVDPGVPRVEYKKKYGWGVTTRFDNPVKDTELGEQNLRIFENLSETNQVAYERTLYGEDSEATFAFTFDEEDFSSTGGCTRKAVEQVFSTEQISPNYSNPKDVLVETDPRIVKAEQEWVRCMEAAGYDGYTDQDELIEEFEERLDALLGELDPEDLSAAKERELKKLQAEEIKAAVADVECQIKHTDAVYDQVELEVFGRPVSG
jgi:hypothetical protein